MHRRITLVIHAMGIGGAERVLQQLADHWAAAGHEVTLITLAAVETDRIRVDPRVSRVGLNLMSDSRNAIHAVANNLRRLCRLRTAIRQSQPAVVVSFTDKMNITTLWACRGLAVPVVIAERNDPRHQRLSRSWERLRRWTYSRCAALVVQTQAVAETLRPLVGRRPIFVIPNAVARPAEPPATDDHRHDRLLAVGRLDRQKGFDLLLKAFAKIAARFPSWRLQIVGEGPQRAALERRADQLGIGGRVELPGAVDDLSPYYRAAKIFVLSSRYEGFPNALLEAMASGLPAISFDCDSGPREIIRHGHDGLLVPPEDTAALADTIGGLVADDARRRKFADRAAEVAARFDFATFFRHWDDALSAVASQAARPPDV